MMKSTVAQTLTLSAGYTNLMTLLLSLGFEGLAALQRCKITPSTAEPLIVIPHTSATVAPADPTLGEKHVSRSFEFTKNMPQDHFDAGMTWLYVANAAEVTIYAQGN